MNADLIARAIERLTADLDAAKRATPGPWRQGRSVYRTIYGGADQLRGLMDTAEDADHIARHSPAVEIPRLEAMLAILRGYCCDMVTCHDQPLNSAAVDLARAIVGEWS